MINTRTDIHIADRFVAALKSGDETELARLYHPQLRFAIPTIGAEYERATALHNSRIMRDHLRDVEVEVVDRQLTEKGFLSQQVLRATIPRRHPDQRADVHDLPAARWADRPDRRVFQRRGRWPAGRAAHSRGRGRRYSQTG